jgi:hypothetical protein
VALITATSMAHGPRAGLLTVAGTASAMAVQLAVTALGLAAKPNIPLTGDYGIALRDEIELILAL